MTKASLFRDHLIRSEPALAEKLLGRPFSHIETISENLANSMRAKPAYLIEGRYPNVTFRDLYGAYETVTKAGRGVVPVMAGKKAAKQFREAAMALFKNDQSRLFGPIVAFEVEVMRPHSAIPLFESGLLYRLSRKQQSDAYRSCRLLRSLRWLAGGNCPEKDDFNSDRVSTFSSAISFDCGYPRKKRSRRASTCANPPSRQRRRHRHD